MADYYIYRANIAYDGSAYSGFQRQSKERELLTVQDTIEEVLGHLFANPVKITVAGRTDAGVHALGQVISWRSEIYRDISVIVNGGNALLPANIRVKYASFAPPEFHARFSAKSREYEYILWPSPYNDAFMDKRMLRVSPALDIELMRKASAVLIGEHDFSSFSSQALGEGSLVRNMLSIDIDRQEFRGPACYAPVTEVIVIRVKASSFLRRMVRMIVAVLIKAGLGEWSPEDVAKLLEARDPGKCPRPVSPYGLYLTKVEYADGF